MSNKLLTFNKDYLTTKLLENRKKKNDKYKNCLKNLYKKNLVYRKASKGINNLMIYTC